jgi:hypothetical protein
MKKAGILIAGLAMVFASCNDDSLNGITEPNSTKLQSIIDDVVVIDFEEFAAGDIVSTVSPEGCDGSILVMGVNPDFPGENTAMAFDSSNPTGGDFDLGTPNDSFGGPGVSLDGPQASNDTELGTVLIISEDLDGSDPDDSYVAGSMYEFDFSGYGNGAVTLHSFDMLDLDPPGANDLPTVVTLYDALDNVLLQKELPYESDNAKQLVDLEATAGVVRMVLELNNSGAIDNIMLTCEDREFEIGGCETMFAKGNDDIALCFIDDEENNFNRWGWTNGPLSTGTYSFDIYAGAGQCDITKGALAGTVELVYDADLGEAVVTYMTNEDYVLTETHLYIGSDPYPLQKKGKNYVPTVAPGQFPYQHGDLDNESEDSFTISGLSGEIYIIAHGVVCEVIEVNGVE